MSAPKQLAKRQKLERKRRRKRENRLKQRNGGQTTWLRSDFLDSSGISNGPVGGLKMSKVFEDFVAPMLESVEGLEAHKRLFLLAQTAWNVALEPEHCHNAMLGEIVDQTLPNASQRVRQYCRELLDWLVARKLDSFAAYQRPILGFQLDELEDGGYYLSVASGLVG